jgi:hypothetical protein
MQFDFYDDNVIGIQIIFCDQIDLFEAWRVCTTSLVIRDISFLRLHSHNFTYFVYVYNVS